MKAESLYHLLQIRARKLEERADQVTLDRMRAVQAALKVVHSRGWFEITWQFGGKDFSLNVPEHDFVFYVAGDSARAVEHRGETGNVRQQNWRAAAALWQKLAEISGFAVPAPGLAEAMGLTPSDERPRTRRLVQMGTGLGVAAAGLILGGALVGWGPAAASALLAALLTLLLPTFDDTQSRRPFAPAEIVLVAAGAFLPLLQDASTAWLVSLAAGLALLAWIERAEADLPFAWGIGGILAGLPALWIGYAALLPAALIGAGLVALRLLLPRRLAATDVAWCLAGLIAGNVAGLIVGYDMLTAEPVQGPALVIGAALVVSFGFWSFHGLLYRLVPWLAIGTLGAAAIAGLLAGTGAHAVTGLSGLALVLAARLAAAFARAATARRIVKGKG